MENGTNLKEILGTLQNFNRPPWRPGTTALAVMAASAWLLGIYLWGLGTELVPWWKAVLWQTIGLFLALWTNGMEIASPLAKALTRVQQPSIPQGMKLVPDAPFGGETKGQG